MNYFLPVEVVERIDKFAARLEASDPGSHVTRTDAIRKLLLEALKRANIK